MIQIALALLAMTIATDAQAYQDLSIHCIEREECQRLVGRQLWVKVNYNEICATINPATGCWNIRLGSG